MAQIKAIFFDMDGTIIDTEKDGHRVAFNTAFKEFGYEISWNIDRYHELLQIAGGKERIRHDMAGRGHLKSMASGEAADLIKRIHKRKTEIFISLIESGQLPLRPGIHRIMKEAMDLGLVLGVCTTANERAAATVTRGLLSDIDFSLVLAGDVVGKKKPDPEIYRLALERTRLPAESCLAVEDSQNGIAAVKGAGLPVLATTNEYTEKEDLGRADIVVNCLGDPGDAPVVVKKAGRKMEVTDVITVSQLIDYFAD
jgi:HAD superfamily hydrolase (TIGR01509 family)